MNWIHTFIWKVVFGLGSYLGHYAERVLNKQCYLIFVFYLNKLIKSHYIKELFRFFIYLFLQKIFNLIKLACWTSAVRIFFNFCKRISFRERLLGDTFNANVLRDFSNKVHAYKWISWNILFINSRCLHKQSPLGN